MNRKTITPAMAPDIDSFEAIVSQGDWIDVDALEHLRALAPPIYDAHGYIQLKKTATVAYDPKAERERHAYHTFICNGGVWQYAGPCFYGDIVPCRKELTA